MISTAIFCKTIRQLSSINLEKNLLSNLAALIKDLRSTNSINAKVEMIKKKPELRSLLKMIYAPEVRFYIKSSSINKYESSQIINSSESIEHLLKKLSERILTGKAASQAVSAYMKEYHEYEELIKCIIDKNLKARIGYEIVRKSFPEALEESKISSIPVSLGYPIEKYLETVKKSMESGDKWFISRKFDGIRMILVFNHEDKSLNLLTRHLNPIFGLNPTIQSTLKQAIESRIPYSIILDGELVYLDKEGRENFSKTINLVKSMEPKSIEGLEFRVFDLIEAEDKATKFSERFKRLKEIFPDSEDIIKLVDQTECGLNFHYDKYVKKAVELEYEGFIIRRDCELKDGRSKDLLKIKPFQDDEFKVINYEIGPMRLLDEVTKKESTENVLLSVTVDFNGFAVNVGSGFSNSERLEFAKNPEKIMGKIVTVRYQSESKALGRECKSMRFPVFKMLHGNIRTE